MKRSALTILAAAALLGGCAGSSNLVGTWEATGQPPEGFSVAEVTFRDNGTYSAEVTEGGRDMSDSGSWSKSGKNLEFEGARATRIYEARLRGGDLILTDPDTGQSVTMVRSGG